MPTEIPQNPEGTYHIECRFFVYRHKFGHYPSFLRQYGTADAIKYGYTTKFFYLIEDDLDEETANRKIEEYNQKYGALITEIENDDTRWDEFPFKNNDIVYSK